MMNTNKKIYIWISGIVLLLIVILIFTNKNSNPTNLPAVTGATSSQAIQSKQTPISTVIGTGAKAKIIPNTSFAGVCNFIVTYPKPGATVTFPLIVEGVINKENKSNCDWYENMSRAGNVGISYNLNGMGWQTPGVPVPVMINGGLESTTTYAFTTNLSLQTTALGLKSGTPIKLTFTELNTTNKPNPNQFTMMIYLK